MGLGPSVGAIQRGWVSHLSGGPTGMTGHVCCAYVGVGAFHCGCVCAAALHWTIVYQGIKVQRVAHMYNKCIKCMKAASHSSRMYFCSQIPQKKHSIFESKINQL